MPEEVSKLEGGSKSQKGVTNPVLGCNTGQERELVINGPSAQRRVNAGATNVSQPP